MADDRERDGRERRDAGDMAEAHEGGSPERRGPGDRGPAGDLGDGAGADLRDSVERSGATAWLDGGTSEERKEPKGR